MKRTSKSKRPRSWRPLNNERWTSHREQRFASKRLEIPWYDSEITRTGSFAVFRQYLIITKRLWRVILTNSDMFRHYLWLFMRRQKLVSVFFGVCISFSVWLVFNLHTVLDSSCKLPRCSKALLRRTNIDYYDSLDEFMMENINVEDRLEVHNESLIVADPRKRWGEHNLLFLPCSLSSTFPLIANVKYLTCLAFYRQII